MDACMCKLTNGWTHGRMMRGAWQDKRMNGMIYECVVGCANGCGKSGWCVNSWMRARIGVCCHDCMDECMEDGETHEGMKSNDGWRHGLMHGWMQHSMHA